MEKLLVIHRGEYTRNEMLFVSRCSPSDVDLDFSIAYCESSSGDEGDWAREKFRSKTKASENLR